MRKVKIPLDELEAAIEENNFGLGNIGFCLACGEQSDSCEPDARNYTCEGCAEKEVFGAEEMLLMGEYE